MEHIFQTSIDAWAKAILTATDFFVCVQWLLCSVWKMYPYVYSQIMFTCKEMHTRFMDAIEYSQSYHYE